MRRYFPLLLAAALLLAASACAARQRAEENEVPTVETAPAAPEGGAAEKSTAEPPEEPSTEAESEKPLVKPEPEIPPAAPEAPEPPAEPEPKAEEPPIEPEPPKAPAAPEQSEAEAAKELTLAIDGAAVSVAWEDNETVAALRELLTDGAITVQASLYGGFEQVGPLGTSLPRADAQTTASAGDIVLYSGNQIVVFFGSNTWAYTRLGKITSLSAQDLQERLGSDSVTLTLAIQ